MKKYLLCTVILCIFAGLSYAGGVPTRAEGYTSFQYINITSTGITNITWTRRVQEVYVLQKSTHTAYIHPFDVVDSSVTVAGSTPAAQAIDRLAGMAPPFYLLDSNAANTVTTFKTRSNDFSVYVSTTDLVGVTPDIRIYGWGW